MRQYQLNPVYSSKILFFRISCFLSLSIEISVSIIYIDTNYLGLALVPVEAVEEYPRLTHAYAWLWQERTAEVLPSVRYMQEYIKEIGFEGDQSKSVWVSCSSYEDSLYCEMRCTEELLMK